eukprot:16435195-Heterocapsa_arctica.AAC.1
MQIIPIASTSSSVHARRCPGYATRHEEQSGVLQLMLGGPVVLREVVLPIVQEQLVEGCGS